jgi:hypothetical protein
MMGNPKTVSGLEKSGGMIPSTSVEGANCRLSHQEKPTSGLRSGCLSPLTLAAICLFPAGKNHAARHPRICRHMHNAYQLYSHAMQPQIWRIQIHKALAI